MATQALHVVNLEKYVPAYTDRALSWVRIYCRSSYDKKTSTRYRSFLDDEIIAGLDEVNRYRFISLILREVYLGGPVPMDDRNLSEMGWDTKQCSKSRTIRVLHKLAVSVTLKVPFCDTDKAEAEAESEAEYEEEEKAEAEEEHAPDGSASPWLAPDFSHRFASASLRSVIIPRSTGDETVLLRVAEWVQAKARSNGDGERICKQVLELAARANRDGRKPMAMFTQLLRDELGYDR